MRLRIVAGTHGGRYIAAPPGRSTRPTPERVREAWFSALGPDIRDATVLDLFAGSGALGIEALSRGARHVHFVESNRRARAIIEANLSSLGLIRAATVIGRDVFGWLAGAKRRDWDVALADPPYEGGGAARLVATFREDPFARCLWIEHAAGDDEPGVGASWTRRYGDTRVSRFRADDIDTDLPAGTDPV
ncbi:MAG: 16S rRNA (guanine(966)-N(2))-methyltransferase RsmD [Gemmatimonadota bacterium]|nr:16S rRNA (guanine(966)-N(2))-methyltransferase RsmD [Gemmatimonadota bacterium]